MYEPVIDLSSRRKGIGSQMMLKLRSKLSPYRRTSLRSTVKESNLDLQMFLKAFDMKCVHTIKDYFNSESSSEDGYRFEYDLAENG